MKIKVIGSSADGSPRQFAASYLINDSIAIDAGCVGLMSVEAQKRVRHILISHSHLDHIASLPIFIDNVYEHGPDCVSVYARPSVIECLQRHFFNELVWPDLMRLSREESPFLKFVAIEPETPIELDGVTITPVDLDHVVPTFAFIVDDGAAAVAIVSDTGPTQQVWEVANQNTRLKAVLLEAAFPNSMSRLAEKAKHLTPASMSQEYRKLAREVPLLVVHIKPAFYEEVTRELKALDLALLEISQPNRDYEF